MSADVAMRPRVQQLFWRLTLLWAVVCLGKALATLWLMGSQTVPAFVLFRSLLFLAVTIIATAATVAAALSVARKEGLMSSARVRRPRPALVGR